ncbi:hypothetical protein BS47DRAFT_1367355 [Hydnum rufescens UP504]|uniref:Uncharacterized protein n=1 Tax=Hydnum rufescens UP504 TaxID=1448309 RepID=A0A9P6AKE9_9AGAM|nr:hypothetical protein BS47DRAFT_1367355 [Hydnum rufescens UP504]
MDRASLARKLHRHLASSPPPESRPSEYGLHPQFFPLSHAALSFLHGGISPTRVSPPEITKKERQPPPHPPNPYPGLPGDATDAEHDLYGTNGPLWYRGWALDDEHVVCREVDAVLEKTGTRRLIMGHTPTFDRMVSRCDGKIILIDTGISSAYGGVLSALDIKYSLIPIDDSVQSAPGTRAPASAKAEKYLEQEIIQAIYPGKRDVFVSHEREIAGHAL